MKRTLALLLLTVIALSAYTVIHSTALDSLKPSSGKTIIDIHVHVAGLGYGGSGCYINEAMRNSFRFPFYLWAMDVTEEELKRQGDRVLFDKLSRNIAASETVGKAIILAMDGYVNDQGVLDKALTQVYVPNGYVARETARFDNLLFGASINPKRKDAIERLRSAHREGAVLIKWIPSIMNIDPADPRYIPFYQTMAELDIPLLTHTGMEKSFADTHDALADPVRLKLPLEQGVTVIAAHLATTGQSDGQDNFARILPMFQDYSNLYADISSLTQINKLNDLAQAMKTHGIIDRMLYGSDWPLQFFPLISPWYHINHISLSDAWRISGIDNTWDRDIALKAAFGLPEDVFRRAGTLLKIEP
ncbi:MAG: amidohydrolase family protein [Gammaproteobacteria bacterium]|nr:amidohydrolase family protein [Gammaproteobacteria bacterium]